MSLNFHYEKTSKANRGKMGEKRKGGFQDRSKKKYKAVTGIIEPSTSGIYATCGRRLEKKCQNELKALFEEKLEEYYKEELEVLEKEENDVEEDAQEEDSEKKELSIEDSIKKELEDLKQSQKPKPHKKERLQFIELGCECVVFCKTRRPIDPAVFVERICQDSYESNVKSTRFTQKLTPITFSTSASMEELTKLAKKVLKPHFHKEEGQKPHTFAIKITSRNFSVLDKDDMIAKIAECIGRDHAHRVDLKKYEKLILVECFRNNIGMSVVNNYDKYSKFNLQQIFTKQALSQEDSQSRVRPSSSQKETTSIIEETKDRESEE